MREIRTDDTEWRECGVEPATPAGPVERRTSCPGCPFHARLLVSAPQHLQTCWVSSTDHALYSNIPALIYAVRQFETKEKHGNDVNPLNAARGTRPCHQVS